MIENVLPSLLNANQETLFKHVFNPSTDRPLFVFDEKKLTVKTKEGKNLDITHTAMKGDGDHMWEQEEKEFQKQLQKHLELTEKILDEGPKEIYRFKRFPESWMEGLEFFFEHYQYEGDAIKQTTFTKFINGIKYKVNDKGEEELMKIEDVLYNEIKAFVGATVAFYLWSPYVAAQTSVKTTAGTLFENGIRQYAKKAGIDTTWSEKQPIKVLLEKTPFPPMFLLPWNKMNEKDYRALLDEIKREWNKLDSEFNPKEGKIDKNGKYAKIVRETFWETMKDRIHTKKLDMYCFATGVASYLATEVIGKALKPFATVLWDQIIPRDVIEELNRHREEGHKSVEPGLKQYFVDQSKRLKKARDLNEAAGEYPPLTIEPTEILQTKRWGYYDGTIKPMNI